MRSCPGGGTQAREAAGTLAGKKGCPLEGSRVPGQSEGCSPDGRNACPRGRWDARGMRAGLGTAETGARPGWGRGSSPALSDSAPA